MKLNAIRIVTFTNPKGGTAFRVTGKDKEGKRVRENFKTRSEAQVRKSVLENEIANLPSVRLVPWRWKLTEAQVDTAQVAYDALGDKDLMKAVRYFIETYREPVTNCELQKALDEFIAEKTKANCRPRTLENQKNRVGALIKNHIGKYVSDITRDHVFEHIHRPSISPLTKNTDLTVLSVFFTWAVERGYCASNPCAKIERVRYDAGDIQILPLRDVQKLFAEAATFKGGRLLPYFALATFCALRPNSEIGTAKVPRLKWEDIDLSKRVLRVRSTNKTRSSRLVEISDNCAEMLAPFALQKAPIISKNFRRDFDALRRLIGYSGRKDDDDAEKLKQWPADVLRHTGGSHHFSRHDEVKTAKWMGNSATVVHKHYNGLPDKEDTEAFWRIGLTATNIVPMDKAA